MLVVVLLLRYLDEHEDVESNRKVIVTSKIDKIEGREDIEIADGLNDESA